MILSPDMDPMEVIEKSERDYKPGSFYMEAPEDDPDPIIVRLRLASPWCLFWGTPALGHHCI